MRFVQKSSDIGRQFGDLVVLAEAGFLTEPRGKRRRLLQVQCKCGSIRIMRQNTLRTGHAISCGCQKHMQGSRSKSWRGYGQLSKSYWVGCVHGAKSRNLAFNITMEYAWSLFETQDARCALTGLPIKFYGKRAEHSTATASLDRIKSNLGYEVGNVQWVHKHINRMKQEFPEAYFVELCAAVAAHAGTKANTTER